MVRLVTLTYPGGDAGDLWAAHRLLVKRIRRDYGRWEYCGCRAVAPGGLPHLHEVTVGAFVPQGWLSKQWLELTGYSVVDIRALGQGEGAMVARYVARQVGGYVGQQGQGRLLESAGWLRG